MRILPLVSQCLLCSGFLALVSCGSSGSSDLIASTAQGAPSMEERIKGGYTVGEDEQGNPRMQSDRRSQFENRSASGTGGQIAGKNYNTKEFSRSRWSGHRDYGAKRYNGEGSTKGYEKSPVFIQKNAHLANNSRFSQKGYNTSQYATSASREQGGSYRTGSNAYTDSRRNKRPKAPITTFQQEQQLTIEDTKKILGR